MQENSPCGAFAKESKLLFNMVAEQPLTICNVNWFAMLDTLEHTDQGACMLQLKHTENRDSTKTPSILT